MTHLSSKIEPPPARLVFLARRGCSYSIARTCSTLLPRRLIPGPDDPGKPRARGLAADRGQRNETGLPVPRKVMKPRFHSANAVRGAGRRHKRGVWGWSDAGDGHGGDRAG